jgi:hypothetical protein
LVLSGCGRRAYDPCAPQTFNQAACQEAIDHNGYYYGGQWYPHTYNGGFSAYYNSYYSYVRNGGTPANVTPSDWARPAGAATTGPAASSGDSSVSRGVFGSSAHSSGGEGSGGHGGGE